MKKRYCNPFQREKRGLFHFLLWQLGFYDNAKSLKAAPGNFFYPNPSKTFDSSVPTISWINHSTFLVKAGNYVFLTDPIWSERCSPFSFFGPKRKYRPPFSIEQIPRLDFVFISHNHYDHLDLCTIRKLHEKFSDLLWIVPQGVKEWFTKRFSSLKKEEVVELGWWETFSLEKKEKIVITSVPAQHFSGRGLFDRNTSLWMGFVADIFLSSGKKRFYFAGDTGYNSHDFNEIGKRFAPIDLSLLPIGSYIPRGFMYPVHIHPGEAVKIHLEVSSQLSVGGHWGTFKLSEEPLDQPPYDLYLALEQAGISCEKFRVLAPGQVINW